LKKLKLLSRFSFFICCAVVVYSLCVQNRPQLKPNYFLYQEESFLPLHKNYESNHIKQMIWHLIIQVDVETSQLNALDVENLIEGEDDAD
jgi:ABC-type microcin C transport system permease subunit YejE